jgi:hypothetical protein
MHQQDDLGLVDRYEWAWRDYRELQPRGKGPDPCPDGGDGTYYVYVLRFASLFDRLRSLDLAGTCHGEGLGPHAIDRMRFLVSAQFRVTTIGSCAAFNSASTSVPS